MRAHLRDAIALSNVKILSVIALLVIVTFNAYSVYADISLEESTWGIYGSASTKNTRQADGLEKAGNLMVPRDTKVSCPLNSYFETDIDVIH